MSANKLKQGCFRFLKYIIHHSLLRPVITENENKRLNRLEHENFEFMTRVLARAGKPHLKPMLIFTELLLRFQIVQKSTVK